MPDVWGEEWLNVNSQRRYPLTDDALLQDSTASFTLPRDLIVDISWTLHVINGIDPTLFHVSNVSVFGQSVTITVGHNNVPIATLTVLNQFHTRNRTYPMTIVNNDFSDNVIQLTIGILDSILDQPAGSWNLDVAAGRLLSTVIRPDLRGVTALYIRNGETVSEAIQGDIEFVAGSNCRLTLDVSDEGYNVIRIDAIEGEGLTDDCECTGATVGPPIRTINGVRPRSDGNLVFVGDSCIEVEAQGDNNTIKLNDRCSEPCCGCQELEVVQQAVADLSRKVTTADGFAARLEAVTTQLQNTLLASKITYDPTRLQLDTQP